MGPEKRPEFQIVTVPGVGLSLRVQGSTEWIRVIRRALPQLPKSVAPAFAEGPQQWRMSLPTANAADIEQLSGLLRLLQSVVFLKNDLDECVSLAWHSERVGTPANGQPIYGRTPLGELVHAAKPYNRDFQAGDLRRAAQLAAHLTTFINSHPTYSRADAVVPVPPSNLNKPFDLPRKMAQEVSQATGKLYLAAALRKNKDTRPMKEVPPDQKKQNILGAFTADTALAQGRSIILIDDLYGSGATICEAGRTLKAAGASLVLGLTATKNLGNK